MIITHRISTIRNVDYVALIERGKVVEFGDRESILAQEDGKLQSILMQ